MEKPSQKISYLPFQKRLHNKFLLWYGCRQTSALTVLREGVKLPSQEQSVCLRQGRGIYLYDSFSQAANKACQEKWETQKEGIVFLCEAALGDMHVAFEADQMSNGLPLYKHSVYGVG